MVDLADLILARFKGRPDFTAVANGEAFAPDQRAITAERLRKEHLSGERCLGFYLLDEQSRCWCTTVDFDNKVKDPDPEWKAKAERVYYALSELRLSPLVEISQSGNGAHVWLFLSEPTPAWSPRAWWRALANRLNIRFKEIYPRQDTHDGGKGMGNLVRYPLWNQSSFVDVENDWALLDPIDALKSVRDTCSADLSLLAFEAGMGELRPDPKPAQSIVLVDTDDLMPLRVQRLIEKNGSLLSKRWRGETTGMKDTSKSAIAMSICTELVRSYVPTPEIASALRHWCRLNGAEKKGDRDDWIGRTVSKAYDFVLTKYEAKSIASATFQSAAHAYLDRIERGDQLYAESGIAELDHSIEGVGEGEVCIIAGRPNHGKTAVGLQWIDNVASNMGWPGLFISEEMGIAEVGKRRVLSISDIPQDQWVAASVSHIRREIDDYHNGKAPVHLVESCCTIDRVEELCEQYVLLHGVKVLAIDYLQLLGARAKHDRYEIVTEVSVRVKQLTRRLGLRTLLLCQLNRSVEGRDDHEPRMSDLRESGQIEQDADLIIFTQYPCRFDSDIPKDVYRFWCAKRRNGAIRESRIETKFNPNRQFVGITSGMPKEILDL